MKKSKTEFLNSLKKNLSGLEKIPLKQRVDIINAMRKEIARLSPFSGHPVDYIAWVPADKVKANDYNPNSVAPPELELLKLSIQADGYTQPIVANSEKGSFEVVDGFHRNRVGREDKEIQTSLYGYLPIVQIRKKQTDKSDRMASTIRHNRARGKHRVEGMSDIVLELKRRNWSNEKIGKQLGMDPDEVLRLTQIAGLADIFKDREFSEAWEAERLDDDEEIIDDLTETEEIGGETEVFANEKEILSP